MTHHTTTQQEIIDIKCVFQSYYMKKYILIHFEIQKKLIVVGLFLLLAGIVKINHPKIQKMSLTRMLIYHCFVTHHTTTQQENIDVKYVFQSYYMKKYILIHF